MLDNVSYPCVYVLAITDTLTDFLALLNGCLLALHLVTSDLLAPHIYYLNNLLAQQLIYWHHTMYVYRHYKLDISDFLAQHTYYLLSGMTTIL